MEPGCTAHMGPISYGTHMGSSTGFHMGPIWAGPCKYNKIHLYMVKAGADPVFLTRGFKFTKEVLI